MRQIDMPKIPMVPDVTARVLNQDGLPAIQVTTTLDIPPKNANQRPAEAGNVLLGFVKNTSSPKGTTKANVVAATSAGRNHQSGAVPANPRPAPMHIKPPASRMEFIR